VQGDRGGEGEARRRRIAGPQADEGAGVEVAGRRGPRPALPPLAAGLDVGAQPRAFGRAGAGEIGEIVVGRAGLDDGADQNSAPAALAEAKASGPTMR
jgi:hypothetical protein